MRINQIIDVKNWPEKKNLSVIYGTRPKIVLKQSKMGKVYFLAKSYEKDIGELRSEVCASNIGREFDFSVQKTWFCKIPQYKEVGLKEPFGVLIQLDVRRERYTKRNQFRENLLHGSALISNVNKDFGEEKEVSRRRSLYTLELTIEALRNYVSRHKEATHLWEQFFELMVFDALIGGTDRHENNWGILEKADDGTFLRLAPAFDNGISLLWKMNEYRPQFIKDLYKREFPKKAKSLFKKTNGGHFTLFEVIEALYSIPEYKKINVIDTVLRKINAVKDSDLSRALLQNVPLSDEFFTNKGELNLILEYVKIRREILRDILHNIKRGRKN